jgi:hypothetical protein
MDIDIPFFSRLSEVHIPERELTPSGQGAEKKSVLNTHIFHGYSWLCMKAQGKEALGLCKPSILLDDWKERHATRLV